MARDRKRADGAEQDGRLPAAGAAVVDEDRAGASGARRQPPAAWCAMQLIEPAARAGKGGLIYAASSERRADEIGRALRQFAPDLEVLVLPPWDCLPYDRASPSRECMGRRMAVLARLAGRANGPRVLVASVEALMQRIPPPRVLGPAFLTLEVGEVLDRARLRAFAVATGYVEDERIDEPGEIALFGNVMDIFPAAAAWPVRISLDPSDRILELRRYDPLSQRTEETVETVVVGPASELILDPANAERRVAGAEHDAAEVYGKMGSVFSLARSAAFAADRRAAERARDFADQVAEAYEARRSLADVGPVLAPEALYLSAKAFRQAAARCDRVTLDDDGVRALSNFARERNPGQAVSSFIGARLEAGRRIVLAGLAHELRPLSRAIKRGLDLSPQALSDWGEVEASKPGGLLSLTVDLDQGFEADQANLVVITASDVLGGRVALRPKAGEAGGLSEQDLRVGDVVIHEDHGLAVLRALERVTVDGVERDALRLEYYGGAELLAPIEEFNKIWRYGAEPETVVLDRLHTDAWSQKRAALSADIDRTATALVELARTRAETPGPVLSPPKAAYARFAARFPYPETPDQTSAIEAVLQDLSSGRLMSRLICGDVGFGKTEVALRAAAAAVFSGKQVALAAPTTVLARQHYDSFQRRFAGTGVTVARLSRLASKSEAAAVKARLADGAIRVVVGTHAIAAADVVFADLGLMIIDEEQRFGAKAKADLRARAPNTHLLTMTATPIPRTLQMAIVGIEDVSVIATPPARRRPIRTFVAPWDDATVRTALLRERRRGGQSFIVAPRIEDIDGLAETLRRLAPELTISIAHGELPPQEIDDVMVAFARGEGDVLLATNIIESGLDVPRANTMLIWRADLFGLAQLHQLRGRVGRGRTQGVAYLLHDPAQEIAASTRARLSTLEAFDRLGSGLAISARDLELRGAGDLIGDEQAGHLKIIGVALYQKLLTQAVQVVKGEINSPDWTPELNIGPAGAIPETYVPDATVRINLYLRLSRMVDGDEVDDFEEELEDRFGALPQAVAALLDHARILAQARGAGVIRIDAGPKAVAFSFAQARSSPPAGFEVSGPRWLKSRPSDVPAVSAAEVMELLRAISGV